MSSYREATAADLTTCATCFRDYVAEEESGVKLDNEDVCEDCKVRCAGCEEWISDRTIAMGGPVVNFRDAYNHGKILRQHASCAAETLLTRMDASYAYDYTTKYDTAAIVELHTAQAVVLAKYPDAEGLRDYDDDWYQILYGGLIGGSLIAEGRTVREAWIDAAKEVQRANPAA